MTWKYIDFDGEETSPETSILRHDGNGRRQVKSYKYYRLYLPVLSLSRDKWVLTFQAGIKQVIWKSRSRHWEEFRKDRQHSII